MQNCKIWKHLLAKVTLKAVALGTERKTCGQSRESLPGDQNEPGIKLKANLIENEKLV